MFRGHFAVALRAKRIAPRTSLGLLVLGAQLADLVWPIYLLLGWESVRIAPGITRVTPFDFVRYPISHGLVADILWGALLEHPRPVTHLRFAAPQGARGHPRDRRNCWITRRRMTLSKARMRAGTGAAALRRRFGRLK